MASDFAAERVANRNSPHAILPRESFRDAGKVKKRTLANLSKWPPTLIEGLHVLLKGGGARAGFFKAYQDRDYATIIAVTEKIPEAVLQEDQKRMLLYDQALTRTGGDP